jgi:hypothetical protein
LYSCADKTGGFMMSTWSKIDATQQAANEAWQVMQDLKDIQRDLSRVREFASSVASCGEHLTPSLSQAMSRIADACDTLIGEVSE